MGKVDKYLFSVSGSPELLVDRPKYGNKAVFLLENQKADDLETWFVRLVTCAHHSLFKNDLVLTLNFLQYSQICSLMLLNCNI